MTLDKIYHVEFSRWVCPVHCTPTCTYALTFSIPIPMTNEMWSSVNRHTSLDVLLSSYLINNNNTRLGTFKNNDTFKSYNLMFKSHT